MFCKSAGRFFPGLLAISLVLCVAPGGFTDGALYGASFSGRQTYRAALRAFQEHNYYSARLLLQEILHKDPGGEFGDDARYYIALAYYYDGDYNSTLFEIRTLLRDYPHSEYVPRASYWVGESHYYLKEYRKALDAHYEFVKKFPESKRAPYALYTIGYIYNLEKRYDDAVHVFKKSLDQYPDSSVAPSVAIQLGISHYNNREYLDARRQFQALILKYERSNEVGQAQLWIGKTYYAEKKYDLAQKQFGYVLEKFPDDPAAPDAIYHIALCRYRLNDPDGALLRLNEIIEKHSGWEKAGSAYFRKGQILQKKEDFFGAAENYRVVVEKYPQSDFFVEALELLADGYNKSGDPEEALSIYNRLLANFDLTPEAEKMILRKQGKLLFLKKEYQDSAASYARLHEKYPTYEGAPEAIYMRAQSYYKIELYDQGLKLLDTLIKDYPNSQWKADAYFLQGEIYYALTNYTKALQKYNRLVRFYKGHHRFFDAHMGVGWSYFELKQYARASDRFRRANEHAKSESQKARVLLAIASCRYNLRDFEDAIEYYDKVIATFQESQIQKEYEEAHFQKGWVYFRQKLYLKAAENFLVYLNKFPQGEKSLEAGYFRGWSFFHSGEYTQALEIFKDVYSKGPKGNIFKEKALFDMAKTFSAMERYKEAAGVYLRFTKEFSGSASEEEAFYALSMAYIDASMPSRVPGVVKNLQSRYPNSAYTSEILRRLANHYRQKGDHTSAEYIYRQIAEDSESFDERMAADFARIHNFAQAKKYDQALKIAFERLKENPAEVEPYRLRLVSEIVSIYLEKGDEKKALSFLAEQKGNQNNSRALKGELSIIEARIYIRQKKFAKALKLLKPLLSDSRFSIASRYYSALAYYLSGDTGRAFDYFRQVSGASQEFYSGWSYYYLGEIQMARKNYLKAARDYTKIVYLFSGNRDLFEKALYKSALAFLKAGKEKEYQIYREKLAENFPDSPYLRELK